MPRLIDADAFITELNNLRIKQAIKWGINAIADRDDEIKIRAEQAVATFCEASLTAKKMPTVDAEPVRHGHWINHFDDLFPEDSSVECSVCHEYEGIMANDNYCPNCGAKMDESSQL